MIIAMTSGPPQARTLPGAPPLAGFHHHPHTEGGGHYPAQLGLEKNSEVSGKQIDSLLNSLPPSLCSAKGLGWCVCVKPGAWST